MKRDVWLRRLKEFKEREEPEAVLMVAGDPELMRIVVAWTQTTVARARRLTRLPGASEVDGWVWLWENARFDREELLARIPNGRAKTQVNLDALIANRVLYPDGTVNRFVERYLKERVLKLFVRARQKPIREIG